MSYNFLLLEAFCKSLCILKENKMRIEAEQGAGPAGAPLDLAAVLGSCLGRFVDMSKVMPDMERVAAEWI